MARYVLSERAAQKLKGLLAGDFSSGRKAPVVRAPGVESTFAHPFELRYSRTLGDWLVWLPGADVVSVSGVAADPRRGLQAAENLPGGWYQLGLTFGSLGGDVYLHVAMTESPSATFSSSPLAEEEGALVVHVASVAIDPQTHARSVRAHVSSALILGGGSVAPTPSPFQLVARESGGRVTRWLTRCAFVFDGALVEIPDVELTISTGTVYLNITRAGGSDETASDWEFAVAAEPAQSSEGGVAIAIPLYEFAAGAVACDFRTTFLTVSTGAGGARAELRVNGELVGYVLDGDGGNIVAKPLAPGDGVRIIDLGGTLLVEAETKSPGFTGERHVLADVDFASPNLRRRYHVETWADGVLVDTQLGEWEIYHRAVLEST